MKRIGVVILNYKNYKETVKCVESVLNQDNVYLKIAIVDNGSNNESYDMLLEEFKDNEEVSIIKNNDNLGYAKGNNVGICFLRKLGYEYILVCNSDVIFSTNNILFDMVKSDNPKVGTIIPIIKNLDGTIEMRAQYKVKLFIIRVLRELRRMQNLSENTLKSQKIKHYKMENLNPGIQDKYYVITGSVFMLTPSFFKYYKGLFSETFLYVEELATLLLVYKAGLKCAIAKTDDVIHKGAASTEDYLKAGTEKKKQMIANSAGKVEKLVYFPRVVFKRKCGMVK